jgi:4-amino-4-deoxy-L-arabinose transferase-like glycosyltransferase
MERTFARRPWWELAAAAGIVALAGWLRLRGLGLVEFKSDEATGVDLARRLLDGTFPTVGLRSSVGALNPPLFVYLTAIPFAVSDDPLAATAFVGVVAAAAVGLTYLVLRPRFGALAALGTAVLLATGPWAVLYGRKIWAQDLLPIFTVSLLWTLFVVLERRRTRAVLLVPVLLCLVFQLNFSAVALVVPAGLVLLCRARDVHWPAFAVGAVVAVLLLGPWLGHEAGNGFDDVGKLLSGGRGDPGSALVSSGSVEAVRQTVRILGAGNWDYVVGASHAQLADEAGTAWGLARAAGVLVAVLLAVGLVTSAVSVVRGGHVSRRRPFLELDAAAARRAVLLVWLGGIWLSYATSARDRVFPHYLIVTYPVSFALAALGLSDLVALAGARFRPVAAAVAVAALALVVAGFVAFTLGFHRFLDLHGGADGDYGVVYADSRALARAVRLRGLRIANDPVLDFLVSGRLGAPAGSSGLVPVEYHLDGSVPSPCDGRLRTFGPLSVCLPPL